MIALSKKVTFPTYWHLLSHCALVIITGVPSASQEKKSPCISRHFLVDNSSAANKHKGKPGTKFVKPNEERNHELTRPQEVVSSGVVEAEDGGGGPALVCENVCVINACQVSLASNEVVSQLTGTSFELLTEYSMFKRTTLLDFQIYMYHIKLQLTKWM